MDCRLAQRSRARKLASKSRSRGECQREGRCIRWCKTTSKPLGSRMAQVSRQMELCRPNQRRNPQVSRLQMSKSQLGICSILCGSECTLRLSSYATGTPQPCPKQEPCILESFDSASKEPGVPSSISFTSAQHIWGTSNTAL